MIKPLEQFYCDTCGELIEDVKNGWFEWLRETVGEKTFDHSFRICHHTKECRLHSGGWVADSSLVEFTKEKGIIRLLKFLDMGETIISTDNYDGPSIRDFREYTEIFRRLAIPYYEEARQYWNEAEHDGEHHGVNEIALYLPDRLERLVKKYSESD
jgi:hypothetical protein